MKEFLSGAAACCSLAPRGPAVQEGLFDRQRHWHRPSAGGVTLTVNSAMLGLVPGGSMGIAASS